MPELRLHLNVEAMIDEDELRFPRGQASDEDVAGMWVGMDRAP